MAAARVLVRVLAPQRSRRLMLFRASHRGGCRHTGTSTVKHALRRDLCRGSGLAYVAVCRTMDMLRIEDARPRFSRPVLPRSSWGRFGFDGGKDSRDACRAPLTRKSDGTSVNCGYSVRSHSLISCERPSRPRPVVGNRMPFKRAGDQVAARHLVVRPTGSGARRFFAAFTRRA